MRTVRTLMLALVMTCAVAGLAMAQYPPPSPNYEAVVVDWKSPRYFDAGGTFSKTFQVYVGPGYELVKAHLKGWDFAFTSSDHHIDRVGVRISSTSYNSSNGYVTVTVHGSFHDHNLDDDYYWQVWLSIVAMEFWYN